ETVFESARGGNRSTSEAGPREGQIFRQLEQQQMGRQFTSANGAVRQRVLSALREALTRPNGPLAQLLKFDPEAKIGIRGSTATGRVGNPFKSTLGQPWNSEKFDLDISIVSDKLNKTFGDKIIPLSDFRDTLFGSNPDLFKGLKPGGEGVSIKF